MFTGMRLDLVILTVFLIAAIVFIIWVNRD